MLSRFYDEGRKTASFKHPNIVTIFELGDDNGIPYIVMELVDGNPLDSLIASDQPIPMVDRLKIVEELCSALAYAHRSNVIHRDVKPANIYVQPDGHVKLLDFGIARLEARKSQDLSITRPGHIIGTLPTWRRSGCETSRSTAVPTSLLLEWFSISFSPASFPLPVKSSS